MSKEQRRSLRLNFRDSVHFRVDTHALPKGCASVDLSEGGIRIYSNDLIPLDTVMQLRINFQDSSKFADVHGKVAWVRIIPHSERYEIGIEFVNTKMCVDSIEEIKRYLLSLVK